MWTTILTLAFCCSLVGSSSVELSTDDTFMDGKQYARANVGITYNKRHTSDHGPCRIKLDGNMKLFAEGELVKIKTKWYKVENCQLHRAYPITCGSELLYQIRDLACSLLETNKNFKFFLRRQTKRDETSSQADGLLNSCCTSACTLAELVQSCPMK